LSIVIGIILGEVSMSLGIFMKDVLIVLSIYTISNFSIPSYELSLCNKILTLLYFMISIIFGFIGFLIINIVTFIHLISLKVLDYPYLYPLIPLNTSKLKNKLMRKNSKKNKKL
jgi:stage V sporulation protein AF